MKKLPGAILILIVASVLLAGCTKYANQSEMQQLSNLKNEVASLEQQISTAQQQVAELKKQIADKQDQVKKVQSNEQFLQQKLQAAGQDTTSTQ